VKATYNFCVVIGGRGSHLKAPPSNLRALVKTTVLAGMLRPVEKVSVANSTCSNKHNEQCLWSIAAMLPIVEHRRLIQFASSFDSIRPDPEPLTLTLLALNPNSDPTGPARCALGLFDASSKVCYASIQTDDRPGPVWQRQ